MFEYFTWATQRGVAEGRSYHWHQAKAEILQFDSAWKRMSLQLPETKLPMCRFSSTLVSECAAAPEVNNGMDPSIRAALSAPKTSTVEAAAPSLQLDSSWGPIYRRYQSHYHIFAAWGKLWRGVVPSLQQALCTPATQILSPVEAGT